MPDNEQISEHDANRLLDALEKTPYIDAETDERIDADITRLLPPNESAALHTRLLHDDRLAAVYRARLADLQANLTPDHVAEVSAQVYERLREQFPILRPAASPPPSLAGDIRRRCSEAVRQLIEAFYWNIVAPTRNCTTESTVSRSGDRTAAFTTAPRRGGGVRFVVTSYNPQDAGLQLEFSVQSAGGWRQTVTLERSLPGVDVWEAVLELSSADVKSLTADASGKIHARPLLS